MACPDKTEFDPQCRTCVHPEQRSQEKSKSRFLATFNSLISCILENTDLKLILFHTILNVMKMELFLIL